MSTIIEWIQEHMLIIIGDLWTVQLSLIGITVSVMALLFASHVGKVETHRHISKSKNINNELLSLYLLNGIKTFDRLNGKVVPVFICACCLFGYSCVVKYISCIDVLFWLGLADLLLTVVMLVWIFFVIMRVVRQYKEEVK